MSSSEALTCEECGAIFSTIEALDEHRKAEQEDKKLRNTGLQMANLWDSNVHNVVSINYIIQK